ncbi:MAG TPA: M28 family peptidase [Terriglobales bacterium]|nr:M28 family peptidase [Terriglobales bacterium]
MRSCARLLGVMVCLGSLAACTKAEPERRESSSKTVTAQPAASEPGPGLGATQRPATTVVRPRVQGERALSYVRQIVAFGPRPPGSEGHRKVEAYLRRQLKSDNLEEDAWTAQTPAGPLPMRNFVAKFPGEKDGIIVLATHYETNYPLKNYVGANDGGSSTGLLLELAHHLRGKKRKGYSVWLAFLDGEEAVREWSAADSLYGSRRLAERWTKDGTVKMIKAFLLADLVGDRELHIDRDLNSTPWLLDVVQQAAANLGYQSYFFQRAVTVEDDHLPFRNAGVPVADLIDFEYGYGNVFHHTPEDTWDKLSAKSLQVVGEVMLETVRLLDER